MYTNNRVEPDESVEVSRNRTLFGSLYDHFRKRKLILTVLAVICIVLIVTVVTTTSPSTTTTITTRKSSSISGMILLELVSSQILPMRLSSTHLLKLFLVTLM
ncbi:unnamed protein product [Adineta steineri]|uniref:Uncharacterized protein n=1 Tax=Adineta steineri TaxID=433720 RepID=A0A819CYH2_9BILA|nr:unnamed protein product [Adineta steineri]CAF4069213.1 unnamed protein product [Adineta steineri]